MRKHPKSCSGCPLNYIGTGFIDPEGSCTNGVLIIGEAAGEAEAKDDLPFRPYAQAGSILERCISKAGFSREEFGLFNLLACRPPGNKLEGQKYEKAAVDHCKIHFRSVLARFKPRVILALGNVPCKWLTGMAGPKKTISLLRGFVFDSIYGVPVIPSLHPAFIARGKSNFIPVLIRDLQYAVQIAAEGINGTDEKNYLEHPSISQALEYLSFIRDNPALPLAYDIETGYSLREPDEADVRGAGKNIVQIQFSHEPHQAIVFPWVGEYIEVAKSLLELSNEKWNWNGHSFDDPILEEHGTKVRNSRDLMWCLRGDTKIPLSDGSWKYIKEIVDSRLSVVVQGLDDQSNRIDIAVSGWHSHHVKGQEWLRVKNDGTRFPLNCTPDHRVWTRNGWKRADQLEVGESVRIPKLGTDALIHGSLLGDGYYNRPARSLAVMHGAQQEEYARAKAFHMGAALCRRINKGRNEFYFSAVASWSWKEKFYTSTGKQFVPPIDDAALAVWYMDDGNWHRNKGYGLGRVRIPVAGFNNQEDVFIWAQNKFGKEHIALHHSHSGDMLVIKAAGVTAFFNLVAPYMHPSMSYKIPEDLHGNYSNWLERQEPQWAIITEIGPSKRTPKGFDDETRYCLTVAHESHRFFTFGGLVANCWHHLQPDLPRGLQFVTSFYAPEIQAWKHLSDSAPQLYGGIDVDALSRIGQRIFTDLDKAGIRRGYDEHIVKLRKVLDETSRRGFPTDVAARTQFRATISARAEELDSWIQSRVPETIRKIYPPSGFKVNPKEVREIAEILGVKLNKGRDKQLPEDLKLTVKANLGLDCKGFEDGFERFFKYRPFLAASDDQVKAYIKACGYKMPTKLKEKDEFGNAKETTEKKGLERLYKQTKDDFFLKLIEYRELSKIVSTYLDGWKPDANGRVHTEFLFAPATGQLSSRNPNIQNVPKGGDLANEFRKTIRPKAGHVLLAFDYSAFHALMLGYVAKDRDYMLLSRLDIHSYLAGHLLRMDGRDAWLQLPIEDLRKILGEIKENHEFIRTKKAKPAVLGYQLGLGAQKLYDMNLESFDSRKDAQSTIDMLNFIFPKAAAYREDIKKLASQQGYLLSDHGYIRRFFDIYGYRQISDRYEPLPGERVFYGRNGKRYKQVTGGEGEAAIAFPVQNNAHGHAKDAILRLSDAGALDRFGFINFIHDELLFECPAQEADACLMAVSAEMEKPSEILIDPDVAPHGLACGIEASIGKESWAEMEKVYQTDIYSLL